MTPHAAIVNSPGVREYLDILAIARERIADDPNVRDKETCARSMAEAWFQGRLDRERLDRERAA
ncbi:MAG: hypothetical protein ABIZ71_02580 [Gemmatimonadales bacterium]